MKQVLKFTPEFILVCYILLFIFFKHPGETWDRSINSDGKGYYAYLPAFFIYHDLTYKFVEYYEDKYYPPDRSVFKEFRIQSDGKTINKCFPGLAILWLPFFLIAHLLSYFLGFPMDGYSLLYQYAISIAALFYLWLGCRFLMRLLNRSGASVRTVAFITFLIALGTNILYFTIVEDSMSHVYSFALISMFLYYIYRYFQVEKGKYIIISSFLFGLIILVRPTNGLILLLLPLMAWLANPEFRNPLSLILHPTSSDFRSLTSDLFLPSSILKYLISGILILVFLFSIPLIIWHHTTGHWLVYQYGEERFHFLHPHFLGILFSYNRGWFVYTPVALVSIFGFFQLWKENKYAFYRTFFFFIFFIYISSCWWMWYYASKCGQRIFIDLYAFIGILLFLLYKSLQKKNLVRNLLTTILILFTGLNIFQCYQHSLFIFPATTITSEIYWDSFLRIYPVAKVYLPQEAIIGSKSFFTDMEKPDGWENPWTIRSHFGFSGKHCSLITQKHPYSIGRYEALAPLFTSPNRIIKVTAMVWSLDTTSGSTIVVEVRSDDKKLSYNSFYLAPFVQADQWTPVEAAFYILRDIPENSIAKIYFYNNKGSAPLFVDDLKIDFLSLKDEQQYTYMEGIHLPVR
jgi:hypothetical protein